jgi:hypothetical protein
VSGEISHLTRSFEYAVRAGAFEDAVSIFSGLLREGRERVMAGDVLFRVAAEDMAIAGHKLIYAVKGWQLAAALGWRSGDILMGPVVARIATGIRDPGPFETLMEVWGREKMDAEAVGGNAGPAGEAEWAEIRSALRAASPEACARGVILVLKRGASLNGVASSIVAEAAGRVAAADRYDLPAIHGLIFADLARWVLRFSKTSSRIVPVLQAGLVLQALPVATPALRIVDAAGEDALLRRLVGDMEAGAGRDAADRAHTYLAKGYRVPRLLELLAHQACREGPAVNLGHNLILADAVLEEATANLRPSPEPLAALARMLPLSPRDRTAWASLEKRFPLEAISS